MTQPQTAADTAGRPPRVAVIIPTYNRREYVQQAIDSVLRQSYADYEIIVVDDGSTDGTEEALRERYGQRIRYVWQGNRGESVARNRAIALARGEYLAFLDSDDLWLPHKLDVQVKALDENADAGLVCGRAWIIDEEGRRLTDTVQGDWTGTSYVKKIELCLGNLIGGPTQVLVRREVVDRVAGFDPAIRFGEDWDLWLRIAGESRILARDEIVACVRRHVGGQYLNLDPGHGARRLDNRVALLEKAFATGGIPEDTRRLALAHEYGEAFVWAAAAGSCEGAAYCRRMAREHDVRFFTDPEGLGQLITDHVSRLANARQVLDFGYAQEALRAILACWRTPNEPGSGFERVVAGKVYAAFSFVASRAQQLRQARAYALRAIVCDRHWLLNRGLVKNLFKGLLPRFQRTR